MSAIAICLCPHLPAVARQLRRPRARSRCCRRTRPFALAAAAALAPTARRSATSSRFVSGLYFRGKLTYARRFAAPPEPDNPIVGSGVHVITPNAGLRSPDTPVTRAAVRAFARGRHRRRQRALPRGRSSERARVAGARSARLRRRAARQHRVAEVRRRADSRSSASGCCFRSTSSAAAT